jgi:hypothetical protein
MIAEIRKCLSRRPFMPFTIHSADGMALRVPTVDHAAVSPTGNRVIVFLDDGTTEFLFPLLITRVSVEESHI